MTVTERQERLRQAMATWVPGAGGGTATFGLHGGKPAAELYFPYNPGLVVTGETEEAAALAAEAVLRSRMEETIIGNESCIAQTREMKAAVEKILSEGSST